MMMSIMAWEPRLSVAGCVGEIDMTDKNSYTVTGGNTVTSASNKVSGTAFTEATNPPTYEDNGLNGLPCMLGDGVIQRIVSTEAAIYDAFDGSDPVWSVFYVVQPIDIDDTACIFGIHNSAASNGGYVFGTSNSNNGRHLAFKEDSIPTSKTALGDVDIVAGAQIVAWTCTGTLVSGYLNGTLHSSPTDFDVGSVTLDSSALFARMDLSPDVFFHGRLSSLYAYSATVSAADVVRISSRLAAKHGIW